MANVRPAMLVPEAAWGGGGGPMAAGFSPKPSPLILLHALRRRWLMAGVLAVLCAGLVAPAVWFSYGERYTATSYLQVSSSPQKFVFDTTERTAQARFDVYKGTQQQLVNSPFVVTAALRKPEARKLPCVFERSDPVAWLAGRIKVAFPGNAEIMVVRLTLDDPYAATTLLQAVVDSYVDEVVNVERNRRKHHLGELDRVYTDKETEVRRKRTEFKELANQLGTGDSRALFLKTQIALQQFSTYRTELVRHELALRQAHGELTAKTAMLKSIDIDEISEFELDTYVQLDPIAQQMLAEIAWRRSDMNYDAMIAVPGTNMAHTERQQRELQLAQQQYDMRVEELREEMRGKRRGEFERDIRELKVAIAINEKQVALLKEDVEGQRKEAEKFGESSIEVEMMRDEIDQRMQVLKGIADEREKLKVELRSRSRVTLLERAKQPKSPDGTGRLAMTTLAAFLGLCLPAGLIAWWDLRAGRINTATEVSRGLGLPVIGSVPIIPTRAIRQLGSSPKRQMNWHTRLTEAADSIAARLLRKAALEQVRVVLITSAMGGEGKTTLATQLAMSLARSERSAVLVDFDLRRPAFDEIFGLPLQPGVCEFLRGECQLDGVVQQTATRDLAVVTAGRWNRQALTALANGAAGSLFERLREEYDFILVDASPILPVADTRFVSQHVDAAILSVLRDVSQGPKINAACEILRAFGVGVVETVVTGPSESGRYKDLGYEPRLPS